MAFNALTYVKELREVGVPQEQAEVQAGGLQLVQDDLLANLATKQDLERVSQDVERVSQDLERVSQNLEQMSRDLNSKIDNVGKDIKEGIEKDIKAIKEGIEKDIKASQGTQTVQMIGAMAALMAIFRFLPDFLK